MTSRARKSARHKGYDAYLKQAMMGDFFPEDVHLYRLDRHDFVIYVGGDPQHTGIVSDSEGSGEPGVEHNMADRFELNLGILSTLDPERPILIKMASCGGNWEEGMQMFGAILYAPNPITVLATKWARSMTSIIPLAADRFVIRPPAQYMYHHGTYKFQGLGQEADTTDIERRKETERMYRIYVARLKEQGMFSRRSEKAIREMLDENTRKKIDCWFSADEAKRWGFADKVYDGDIATLRITKKNIERRQRMAALLRQSIKVMVATL